MLFNRTSVWLMLPWLGYDPCLFNSAAQVLFFCQVRSWQRCRRLVCFKISMILIFTGIWLFSVLSAKVFMKRQLKFYYGHLIRLLCVLCLSDYGNEAPRQFIKVHQSIGKIILGDGVVLKDRSPEATRRRWNMKGFISFFICLHILLIWCGLDTWNVVCCEFCMCVT